MLATTFCCRGSATKMVIILFYISTRRQQRRGDGQTASILKFNWPKLIRWEMAENCPLFPAVSLCSTGTGDSQVCGANSVISSAEVCKILCRMQRAAAICSGHGHVTNCIHTKQCPPGQWPHVGTCKCGNIPANLSFIVVSKWHLLHTNPSVCRAQYQDHARAEKPIMFLPLV